MTRLALLNFLKGGFKGYSIYFFIVFSMFISVLLYIWSQSEGKGHYFKSLNSMAHRDQLWAIGYGVFYQEQ